MKKMQDAKLVIDQFGFSLDLVTTLDQTLPTVDEPGEPSEVANENASPPPVDKEKSSDDEAHLFITQVPASPVPTSQVRNTAPVRSRSTSTGNEGNPGKKACNSILNYFLSQN